MELDDIIISRAIIESWSKSFLEVMDVDVAIAGAGPAGLSSAYYLAKEGHKVVIFERELSIGGGMWGGGMMYNKCVFQQDSKPILDELGIRTVRYREGYFISDSIETVTILCSKAIGAGAKVFNLLNVEDVMIRKERVEGFVLNWSAVELAELHVDPLTIRSKAAVDATGHHSVVVKIVERKVGPNLSTETGRIVGEKPMWAEVGEKQILANTKEVYPGLWVAGMASNAVFGGPRMGPVFGGMILSGKKVAGLIAEKIPPRT